ncbi:MAG: DNA mismatch repair protein MutS [Candidatus Abyssobacteria bacterium SURF_17]|uniref:DNA mismatch repair protein MutS n=1 Tax=Candidatus Abyssobacteria bacterium SURF_17 TaxID=2093361 RepID=A0A419EZB1_9BACT|nr:MAG: DNA mismatch repair protein MutS [Candidatus Abyssubacteria bacterium SURF_17]
MDELTPMLRQYNRIKDRHRNSILFFRMGDFYEMFFEDAKVASAILEIALTSRDSTRKEDRVPMCGVPYHAAKGYIAKLLRAGKTVAICEQVEDPKLAKGIVRREVVRVITPGTILEPELLDENASNFLAAAHISDRGIGVAFADISTGEFQATEREGSNVHELLVEELLRVGPSEFLFSSSAMDSALKASLNRNCANIPLRPLDDWIFSLSQATTLLTSHYGLHSLSGLGLDHMPLATSAAGAVLHYLKETCRASLHHLKRPAPFIRSEYMILDVNTQRNLELQGTLRDKSKRGSLLGILDATITSMGTRRLRNWITHPLMDRERILARQEAIAELVQSNALRIRIRNVLKEIHDVERLVGRICGPGANARDMVMLKDSLLRMPVLKETLRETSARLMQAAYQSLDPVEDVTSLIVRALVDAPPVTITEGNIIRDGYSPELDSLRTLVRDGKDWIAQLQKKEIRRTGISSLKVSYNKVFGYYIEVTKPNLSLVPPDYIRKQTLVNAERFVTPELKEREAAILGAEEKMTALEGDLFRALREQVCGQTERIQTNADLVAEVDTVQSLAHVAAANDYCRPEISTSFELKLEEGRHPVLEQLNLGQPFVPNDTDIDERGALLVITGPNMAGKSTYLRQVALIVLMAQMGGFVPARQAAIGLVDRIFTRVGASDNLVGGESTFMVEMSETANILNNATRQSLIVLDEIGRGTSTYDGMSIAWAVAEHIHNNIGAKTLFATHYHELTDLAKELRRVKNLNVAVREWNNQVVFLYKVIDGSSDHSYGIHVAKLAGLPGNVIARAREVLSELEGVNPARRLKPTSESNQLQLFAPVAAASPLEDELKSLDIDRLTPLEALAKLAELKRKLNKEGDR